MLRLHSVLLCVVLPAGALHAQAAARHWVWQPFGAPEVPASEAARPVDAFIRARLRATGLAPSPHAGRRTLIRRLSFDLIGLPPSRAEVDAWLADRAPGAWSRLVDRLLASPHFGERWARHWLDLVRYTETRGHEFDYRIPNAWQYRDYVIRALNADVPYDDFVVEHIAGDLLEEPRLHPERGFNESILGTGFWFFNEEVHSPVDPRADECDRIDNRVDVLSKAFLGVTVACARCHDHKFDAIPSRDYYALSGYMLSSDYRQVRFESDAHNRRVAEDLAAWRRREAAALGVARPVAAPPPSDSVIADYSKPGVWFANGYAFGIEPLPAGALYVRADEAAPIGVTEVACACEEIAFRGLREPDDNERDPSRIDWIQAGRTLRTPAVRLTKQKLWYLVRGKGHALAVIDGHRLINGPLHRSNIAHLRGGEQFRWIAHDVARYRGARVWVEFSPAGTGKQPFQIARVVQADAMPAALTGRACDIGRSPEVDAALARRSRIARRVRRSSHTAAAMLDANGCDSPVLVRGNPRTPRGYEPRHFLTALGGAPPNGRGSGRLDLARRIAAADNPLTARVFVNRVWQHLFGRGLVETADNFGVLGSKPSHRKLLDWLAHRFVTRGWSLKQLIRELVSSETYRQSSRLRRAARDVDPDNRLLHRMPVRRLEAEAIRDAMLAVSGDLNPRLYGRPVPLFKDDYIRGVEQDPMRGPRDGRGRRSIYLAVRRNCLSRLFLAFDFPPPATTRGRRTETNVPAQALALLNNPFVVDQARHWARRVLAGESTTQDRITALYETAFARPPTRMERARASDFVRREAESDRVWSDLAHVLFNVKEFIFIR